MSADEWPGAPRATQAAFAPLIGDLQKMGQAGMGAIIVNPYRQYRNNQLATEPAALYHAPIDSD